MQRYSHIPALFAQNNPEVTAGFPIAVYSGKLEVGASFWRRLKTPETFRDFHYAMTGNLYIEIADDGQMHKLTDCRSMRPTVLAAAVGMMTHQAEQCRVSAR